MTRKRGRQPSQRQLRVGEAVRHALAQILERESFHEPELRDASITVTEVRMTPDLRIAVAYVVPLGGGHADTTVAALQRAAGFLRGQVAREVRLKFAPELRFERDSSFEKARQIDSLLRKPEVARDLQVEDDGDAPAPPEDRGGA